jgi:hypothetical protein
MKTATTCLSGESCPACRTSLTMIDTRSAATWECPACGWTATLPAVTGGSQ